MFIFITFIVIVFIVAVSLVIKDSTRNYLNTKRYIKDRPKCPPIPNNRRIINPSAVTPIRNSSMNYNYDYQSRNRLVRDEVEINPISHALNDVTNMIIVDQIINASVGSDSHSDYKPTTDHHIQHIDAEQTPVYESRVEAEQSPTYETRIEVEQSPSYESPSYDCGSSDSTSSCDFGSSSDSGSSFSSD